jgi:hypothetical protein
MKLDLGKSVTISSLFLRLVDRCRAAVDRPRGLPLHHLFGPLYKTAPRYMVEGWVDALHSLWLLP